MKILSGAEIAGYVKENQAHQARALKSANIQPKLVIIRNNDNPVILKYVQLKQRYGADIGVEVEDWLRQDVAEAIADANRDESVHGVIVQLPLTGELPLDELLMGIAPEKDVDGLATELYHQMNNFERFDSATATAINWLTAGYDLKLDELKIALVGYGRLIGKPLARMWQGSGYNVTVFRHNDDLAKLVNYDLIVTATGVPHLIKSEMVRPGAYVIDAGTASEGGILVGDVDDAVRERTDLGGITPKIGGVGPLTVTALFEHLLMAAKR